MTEIPVRAEHYQKIVKALIAAQAAVNKAEASGGKARADPL
jgi:hypothetical protein